MLPEQKEKKKVSPLEIAIVIFLWGAIGMAGYYYAVGNGLI
jgi:hypothetical protein